MEVVKILIGVALFLICCFSIYKTIRDIIRIRNARKVEKSKNIENKE